MQCRFADYDWTFKRDRYLFVVPPIVLTMRLSNQVASAVDEFFQNTPSITKISLLEMRKVFIATGSRHQLSIESSARKANQIISRISKHFM